MSNRHLSRTIALQTLFEWDFHHRSKKLFDLLELNKKKFAPEFDDQGFTETLIKGVTKNLDTIDTLIQQFAPEWPIEQITIVDRNILRIGIYELKFDSVIPPRVAINEAIELAKAFGGESSYRFVNGVLGAIYKHMEETDDAKLHVSEPQHKKTDIPHDAGPQETSAGGVVYRRSENQLWFALIKDAIDKWTFPKGKIGDIVEGEKILEAVAREMKEELGISDCRILEELGIIDVIVNPPGKPSYPKRIIYYLIETSERMLRPEQSVTVKDAQWFTQEEVPQTLGYENAKDLFAYAVTRIE